MRTAGFISTALDVPTVAAGASFQQGIFVATQYGNSGMEFGDRLVGVVELSHLFTHR